MDFFQQQDLARRQTKRLTLLFAAAVITIMILVNFVVVYAMFKLDIGSGPIEKLENRMDTMLGERTFWSYLTALDPMHWLIISASVIVVVLGAALFKHRQISRSGGTVIAENLGGRLLTPGSGDFYERRLLNVVEEMALASGMPVPPVYVLDEEGINAFAAGHNPSDAVVGVTRGCMQKLNREELQGVIAHEFSHILNGDMRFNLKLIGTLHGILFIALIGQWILRSSGRGRRSSSSENKNNLLPLIGLSLLVIGSIGVLFGKLIKAAASRQREFLADASAVQFTRNPQGIGGALKVIGSGIGTELEHPNRAEAAHMFFGDVQSSLSQRFATHPPLRDRILRIEPQWDGEFRSANPGGPEESTSSEGAEDDARDAQSMMSVMLPTSVLMSAGAARDTAQTASSTVDSPEASETASEASSAASTADHNELARGVQRSLIEEVRDPYSARAVIFGLLLSEERDVLARQMSLLNESEGASFVTSVERVKAASHLLGPQQRLELVQRATPALKQLAPSQYQTFSQVLEALILADQEIDIFEWCTAALLSFYLRPHFQGVSRIPEVKRFADLKSDLELTLSYLAHHGHDQRSEAEEAFGLAAAHPALQSLSLAYQSSLPDGLQALEAALTRLRAATPLLKREIIKALEICVQADGVVVESEAQLIYTISALLEAPQSAPA